MTTTQFDCYSIASQALDRKLSQGIGNYSSVHEKVTKTAMSGMLFQGTSATTECGHVCAGVLACSRGVEKGDLVAVSVALDSPKGRLTVHRGSVTEHLKHVPGRPDLYIGACCY